MRYVVNLMGTGLMLGLVILIGCSPTTSPLHPSFGKAVKQAKELQVQNPKASENLEPAEGLHAKSADKAITQYEKSFSREPGTTRRLGILLAPASGGGS